MGSTKFSLSAVAVVLLAGGSTSLAAHGAPADSNSRVSHVTEHPNSRPGTPDRAPENYGIALNLFEANPELWGGAFVDGDVLVVKYANQTSADATTALRDAGAFGPIRLEATNVTYGDLERAQSAVDGVAKSRHDLVSFGPNFAASSVAIDVAGQGPGLDASLLAAMSKVPATVREGVPFGKSTNSRYYDGISYNGGNAIAFSGSNGSGLCSTAFNLTGAPDGYAYAVSAGHCYLEVNKTPSAQPDISIFRTNGTRSTMGRVWTVSTDANGTIAGRTGDLAIFRYLPIAGYTAAQMGSPTVYYGNGDVPTTQRRIVKGTETLPQGYQSTSIYTSGASGMATGLNTGQITPDWVSLVGQTITYSTGFRITGMTIVEDASECVSGGDSGGAVYHINSAGSTMAVGVISGTNGQGPGPTNCRNYYTPIGAVWFGGKVKVG